MENTIIGGVSDTEYNIDMTENKSIFDMGGSDTVNLGVNMLETIFEQSGNDLVISDGKDGNLVIKEWYSSDDNKIETINTADGYSITNAQLQLMIDSMASFGTDDAMSQDIAANSQTMQKSELMSQFWTKK